MIKDYRQVGVYIVKLDNIIDFKQEGYCGDTQGIFLPS